MIRFFHFNQDQSRFFLIEIDRYRSIFLAFFRDLLLDNLFLGDFLLPFFLGIFFDELLPNIEGEGVWDSLTSKNVCFWPKKRLFRRKNTKNHKFSFKLAKRDIGGSILDIFRDCENFRALAFRSIRRSIFSALFPVSNGFSSSGKLLLLLDDKEMFIEGYFETNGKNRLIQAF